MLQRYYLNLRPFIMASVFLLMGCQKENTTLLVRIGDRDSISVSEFQNAFYKTVDKNPSEASYQQKKKFLLEMIDERVKRIQAYAENIDQSVEYTAALDNLKNSKINETAINSSIFGHFINDKTIDNYRKNLVKEAEVQNLVILYKSNSKPQAKRTKEQAKQLSDSLYKVITNSNFEKMASMFSDDIDPNTGKGRVKSERIPFGELPYNYEIGVFNSTPNTITEPINIPNMIVLTRILRFYEKPDTTSFKSSNDEITAMMKKRFQTSEQKMLTDRQKEFMDSLMHQAHLVFNENNIKTFLSKYSGNTKPKEATAIFTGQEQLMELVRFSNQEKITIMDFFIRFNSDKTIPPIANDQILKNLLRSQIRQFIMKENMIENGYLESEEFKDYVKFISNKILVGMIEKKHFNLNGPVNEAEVRNYYRSNSAKYMTAGSLGIGEIYSRSKTAVEDLLRLIRKGVDADKAIQQINNLYKAKEKEQIIKLKADKEYSFSEKNEIIPIALKLEVNDISDVISRSDGTFCIVKLARKKEPVLLSFEDSRKEVESDYLNSLNMIKQQAWLYDLKKRYSVIIFDQNLNTIR